MDVMPQYIKRKSTTQKKEEPKQYVYEDQK